MVFAFAEVVIVLDVIDDIGIIIHVVACAVVSILSLWLTCSFLQYVQKLLSSWSFLFSIYFHSSRRRICCRHDGRYRSLGGCCIFNVGVVGVVVHYCCH